MSRKEKLKELLHDEDELFYELIDKIKQLIVINKPDGRIFLKVDKNKLTDLQLIILYLIGAKFSHELELRKTPEVENQELVEFTGKSTNSISGQISKLKKAGKIYSPEKSRHTVILLNIKEDIEAMLQKIKA